MQTPSNSTLDKTKRLRIGVNTSAVHCFFSTDDQSLGTASELNEENDDDEVDELTPGGVRRDDGSRRPQLNSVDFGPYVDQTPITVHPKLPLETVMDLFKKMGSVMWRSYFVLIEDGLDT